MSYIDAKWEEPELRQAAAAPAAVPVRGGFAEWLAGRIAALRTWYQEQETAAELFSMTDRELHDIGLTRSDLDRMFDPAVNEDLRQRGNR